MIITNDIETLQTPPQSPSDKKEYRLLKLPNGLKVLLVRHPQNVKRFDDETVVKDNSSAVALCVDVGSFEDPSEVQGLSHFLEHMVFMGSTKFPKENEFDQYIKNRNGFDNAMTECEHTIFYFKIGEEHLLGALDRFAQFFVSPLMTPESMEREMEAVESEFQNNINNDSYRITQLFTSLVRDDHPAATFTWGNLNTLKQGIRSEQLHHIVHEFRKRFYKSNRMNLCIQSNLNLDTQQQLFVQYFKDIQPEYRTILNTLSVDPLIDVFKTDFYKKMFYVKSSAKKRKMLLTFVIPTADIDYKDKSLEYLAFLISYEGRDSLNSYFRKTSLALHVTAKIGARNFEGNAMFTFFTIEVSLTRDGYDELARVLDAIFSYLFLIKMTPMDEHKEIFDEFRTIKNTLFNYRNEKLPFDNVQELALNMRYFDDQDMIVGNEMCPEFDESKLKKMIGGINNKKFNLLILSDKFQKYDKVEKWFGTEYAEVDFPAKFSRLWNERWIRKEFLLPYKNRFICKNFDLIPEPTDFCLDFPQMISKNGFMKCFFKEDHKFNLPHGFIYIHFKSELTEASVTNLNMTSIYSMCIKNFLSEKLFPATIAGYSYKLNSVDDGLTLKLSGFSEKLPMIVDMVTKAMTHFDGAIDSLVFETFAKELRKNCYNYIMNSLAFNEDLRLNIIKPRHKFYFDRFKDVDKITYMSFKEFIFKFLKSLKFKLLIQGNFTKSQALEVSQCVIKNFNNEGSTTKKHKNVSTCEIPIGASYLRVKSLLANDKNSVIKNYYQLGTPSMETECLLELLVKVMREPLFNHIRTQEQLGYAVTCSSKKDDNMLGFTITVETQEKRHSSWVVDAKIESFLKDFLPLLEQMSVDDFTIIKRSIIAQKRSPDADLETEVIRNWGEIRENKFQFERGDIEARQLELLRKDDLVMFFRDHFLSGTERKLSVHVVANEDSNSLLQHGFVHLDLLTDDKHNTIKSIAHFKNSLASKIETDE